MFRADSDVVRLNCKSLKVIGSNFTSRRSQLVNEAGRRRPFHQAFQTTGGGSPTTCEVETFQPGGGAAP